MLLFLLSGPGAGGEDAGERPAAHPEGARRAADLRCQSVRLCKRPRPAEHVESGLGGAGLWPPAAAPGGRHREGAGVGLPQASVCGARGQLHQQHLLAGRARRADVCRQEGAGHRAEGPAGPRPLLALSGGEPGAGAHLLPPALHTHLTQHSPMGALCEVLPLQERQSLRGVTRPPAFAVLQPAGGRRPRDRHPKAVPAVGHPHRAEGTRALQARAGLRVQSSGVHGFERAALGVVAEPDLQGRDADTPSLPALELHGADRLRRRPAHPGPHQPPEVQPASGPGCPPAQEHQGCILSELPAFY